MKIRSLVSIFVISQLAVLPIYGWPWSKSVKDKVTDSVTAALVQNKQAIFDYLHPTGTATGLKVHEVSLTWKDGNDTERIQDVTSFTVRFTVYWQGPITNNGFTKVEATFDTESERYTSFNILATNGITKSDVADGVGAFIGGFIQGAVRASQNNQ